MNRWLRSAMLKGFSVFAASMLLGGLFYCENFYPEQVAHMDWERFANLKEVQLTVDSTGHFLHTTQQFSPDDEWVVYDRRNDDTHIGRTGGIDRVNLISKEIKPVYRTKNQTEYGPGVGAATYHPRENKVLFIHGLSNSNAELPYGITRRTGLIVDCDKPDKVIYPDARDISPPFTSGALRGGTHAHTWSADGQWVSFTYNDDIMARLESETNGEVRDMRVVGVMAPAASVGVDGSGNGEQISGSMFTVVVTTVVENPVPGSDQIDRAYEDGWVGNKGYLKPDGTRQQRAIAFLGDTRDSNGQTLTEVFLVDVPDDITRPAPGSQLAGTETTRPAPPMGTEQRRLTHTSKRNYPGVQGPRHWLRSSPDGRAIFFLMKDDQGLVQIYSVSPLGGVIRQVTQNDFSVETTFNLDPEGEFVAYGSGEKVYVTHIPSQETRQVSKEGPVGSGSLRAINWSHDGRRLIYNRKVPIGDTTYFQIFCLAPKGQG